ncbi:hypothetical protein [Bdellovibrio sp. HCB337]|uniref:hypothetical protein n=1 Tax=Bdellovibrio sp. HCB337 TaxID=3394358 RepID=UPI0039A59BB3
MRVGIFTVILIVSELCFAQNNSAVSFYRSQQSLFPSGQVKRDDLEKKILRRDYEPWFRVSWNKKDYEIPGDTVVTDLQLTKNLIARETLELFKGPEEGSGRVGRIVAKTNLQVLQTKSYWAEIYEPKLKLKGWAPLHLLEAPFEDTGVFVTLIDTFLRKTPQSSSEIVTTIPRMVRVTSLGFEKAYLKVQYQGHIGYLDLTNLAGRGDFAMWAFHKHKGWLGISHRENAYLMTVNSLKLPLEDFLAFNPYTDRGVVSQKLNEDGPSIRSRVTIANNRAHRWALSHLEGHGPVWWRMDEPQAMKTVASETLLSNEQLLKREVVSVAFSSKGTKGIASANGIFRTEDGKVWKEIPQFAGQNYPVAIHPDGAWFVGNYRSFDDGKTFETYIKWDKLAQKIQMGMSLPPRHLRISNIEPLSHSRIRIHVDTGVQKVKMQAHILSNEWSLVK